MILMVSTYHGRLLALTTREFRELVGERPKPKRRSFKPVRLMLETYGRTWDAKRGAAMRLAAVLLREDWLAMERRSCADETASTYADAAGWLVREAVYLRKTARLIDKGVGRLNVVPQRCRSRTSLSAEGA
jgi:hypothetical protein